MGKRSKSINTGSNDTATTKSNQAMNKKIKFDQYDESNTSQEIKIPSKETLCTSTNNTTKAVLKKKNRIKKNKKVILSDNDDCETLVETSKDSKNNNKQDDNISHEQNQEEEVKDEDIDAFCDELTEEDNVQYENWVKLIEAKLQPNKKKPV